MKEEKLKRLITAAVATAVVLLILLICIMSYQLISIAGANSKKKKLERQIDELQQQIDDTEENIDLYSQYWFIEQKAREYGMTFGDDTKY